MRLRSRPLVVSAALVVGVSLFAAACSSGSSNSSTSDTGGSSGTSSSSSYNYKSLSGTLNGSGSTFQATFNNAAIDKFADVAPNVTVNYGGGGSGKGKTDLQSQVVQWAGTDSLVKDTDLGLYKGGAILYFPTVAAPITVSYNLSGVSKLQLSAPTLAKIFSTTITTWNDPAIAADNPGVTLPSTKITVVHRSDGSGTTNTFTKYLDQVDKADWTLGTNDTVNWATTTQAGNGNAGVAQLISATPGAVGYVDFPDAVAAKLAFASLKNKSGAFVAPSTTAATAALDGATVATNLTYSALDAPGATAYPITAATYVIVYQNQTDATTGKALQGWLNYLLTDGQALAAPNNYAALPSSLASQAVAQIQTMKIG